MRFDAIVTAAIVPAVIFGVAGRQSVQVTPQTYQPSITLVVAHKTAAKPKGKIVTVKPGDYLAKIAKVNKTTYQRLFAANKGIKDPDLIYPGQKLRIPTASEKLTNRPVISPEADVPAVQSVQVQSAVAPTNQPHVSYSTPANASVWDSIAACESGGNWSINTGNGFYGGLQFTLGSWRAVGGSGYPNQASKSEQIARAQILQSRQGWGAWPACSAKLGLR